MKHTLLKEVMSHWEQLRGMTYDFLESIRDSDLEKKLPFPESQDLTYQFWCIVGAQESNLPLIAKGKWEGFACSLDGVDRVTKKIIIAHMKRADVKLFSALKKVDLLQKFSDGSTPLMNHMILVEHESHHQGQLINFIYAHSLPIPKSWEEKWVLKKT
ncbi:hypothetical protein ACFL1A_02265 [Patescibacteria group bacterium]